MTDRDFKTGFCAALNASEGLGFWGNREPRCPHCGEGFDIDENEAWFLYDEDDSHEVDCPTCERVFFVRSRSSWTFSTDEQEA